MDSDRHINEVCLGEDGKWFYGHLVKKKYKAAAHSGLYAIGNAEHDRDGGNITVLFLDAENNNHLTQATIDISTRDWKKEVVTK